MTESTRKNRLLIVSNRLPVTVSLRDGQLAYHASSGGLASGIGSYLDAMTPHGREAIWIGWPGGEIPPEHEAEVRGVLERDHGAAPVFVDAETMESFYEGFCNDTLWPLFHYFPDIVVYKDRFWNDYRRVNRMFCDAVARIAQPGDTIWVHDYHLMLLPRMLKERLPDNPVGFFLHIPFPSYEVFRMLPARWRDVILEGILGADLIGFHVNEYANYFLRCVTRILGYDHELGRIQVRDHLVEADAFPMGIDYRGFREAAHSRAVVQRRDALRATVGDRKMIVSVDRLDYTKGVVNRLRGYEHFLRTCPQWRKRVVLALVIVPSRENVDEYQRMKRQIDEAIGRINGKYGSLDWTPISYQYTSLDYNDLVAFYAAGDVALVTPLRDGMNLVAKEYVASCINGRGVLILSEMAGAARELGEAVIINPTTREEIAEALETALEMPIQEQARRLRVMHERLRKYDVRHWAREFLDRLRSVREQQEQFKSGIMDTETRRKLIAGYGMAPRRVLLIDYDGTLVPFARHPEAATPSPGLVKMLQRIAHHRGTELVLVSGRPKDIMSTWFSDPALNIVAEHGAWIRRGGSDWKLTRPLRTEWKEKVLPLMRDAADRLPGTFVEEKDYSVVWHYRQAEPELGAARARALADLLTQLTANMDLVVMPGHRNVEVRDVHVSKAQAALEFVRDHEFVLAIGDDTTDEDMFRALPASAYSIRVGIVPTSARFSVPGYEDVVGLLARLLREPRASTTQEGPAKKLFLT